MRLAAAMPSQSAFVRIALEEEVRHEQRRSARAAPRRRMREAGATRVRPRSCRPPEQAQRSNCQDEHEQDEGRAARSSSSDCPRGGRRRRRSRRGRAGAHRSPPRRGEPIPPMITTISAFSRNWMSTPGARLAVDPPRTPARPASAEPTTNVIAKTSWMLMPSAETIWRSSTPARTTMPIRCAW